MIGGVMFLGPVLLLGLVMLLASGVTNDSEHPATDEALEILRNRYASDKIDEEEFEKRRRILEERT